MKSVELMTVMKEEEAYEDGYIGYWLDSSLQVIDTVSSFPRPIDEWINLFIQSVEPFLEFVVEGR